MTAFFEKCGAAAKKTVSTGICSWPGLFFQNGNRLCEDWLLLRFGGIDPADVLLVVSGVREICWMEEGSKVLIGNEMCLLYIFFGISCR